MRLDGRALMKNKIMFTLNSSRSVPFPFAIIYNDRARAKKKANASKQSNPSKWSIVKRRNQKIWKRTATSIRRVTKIYPEDKRRTYTDMIANGQIGRPVRFPSPLAITKHSYQHLSSIIIVQQQEQHHHSANNAVPHRQ